MEKRNLIWTATARNQLEEVYKYVAQDSIIQADKLFDKIMVSVFDILKQPERYAPDKFKKDNKGNYRAFEIYRYRIAYRISKDSIYIVRIRSTDQNPRLY